jgi:hypothetical protein
MDSQPVRVVGDMICRTHLLDRAAKLTPDRHRRAYALMIFVIRYPALGLMIGTSLRGLCGRMREEGSAINRDGLIAQVYAGLLNAGALGYEGGL